MGRSSSRAGHSVKRRRAASWVELVDRDDGPTMFAVAIDNASAPRELEPHEHRRGQLFGASEGLLTVDTRAGRWMMPPGRALWVPPDERHAALAHGIAHSWSLYVSPSACTALPTSPVALPVSPLLRELVARILAWAPEVRTLDAREERLCRTAIDEIALAPHERLHLPMPRSPRLLEIARAVAERPDDARELDAWAHLAAMSKRSFTRHSREETGLSFATWRTQLRMLKAVERLAAGSSVTRLAADLGYESPSAFTAAFRRALGVPPTSYARARRT